MLNPEQKSAFDAIIDRVDSGGSGVFFINGPRGTGKTLLFHALLANVKRMKMIGLTTATSGVAASLLLGGRTTYSHLNIPIIVNKTNVCNIPKQSEIAELIQASKLIIWDEALMSKRFVIEIVDRKLKDIMDNEEEFGGKVLVFGGDFRQVLPVIPKSTREEIVNAILVKLYLWTRMQNFTLTRNMRARGNPCFSEFLLRVGNWDEPTNENDIVHIPDEMVIKCDNDAEPKQSLIECIILSLQENAHSAVYMTERAILTSKNEYVDNLSEEMISKLAGNAKIYNSYDEAINDTNHYYTEEFLNSLTPNGLPPHCLVLKENCPVMLLRNLDPSNGLCNGTRMVCKKFENNVIHAEITMGQFIGKPALIPRIPLFLLRMKATHSV